MSEPEHQRGTSRPDRPTADRTTGEEPTRDELGARHRDLQAELRERSDGANAEQITDEANLRANPDHPTERRPNRDLSPWRGTADLGLWTARCTARSRAPTRLG